MNYKTICSKCKKESEPQKHIATGGPNDWSYLHINSKSLRHGETISLVLCPECSEETGLESAVENAKKFSDANVDPLLEIITNLKDEIVNEVTWLIENR